MYEYDEINPILIPSGYYTYMYDQVKHSKILHSVYTVYLCVLCRSEDKQRLFPYTELSDWFFITEMKCVYCAVRPGF